MSLIIALIVAYLIGSISSGVLVSKLLKLPDPRKHGSGNAGATNMLRTNGKMPAILVLFGDVVKGLIAMIIGVFLGLSGLLLGLVALAVVLGHVFSVFLRFKGGKGVATAAGALLALSPWTLLFSLAIWVTVLLVKRFVSLASIAAAAATPVFLLLGGNFPYFIPFVLAAGVIVFKHLDNIKRIKAGTENTFSLEMLKGQKK